MLSGRYIKVATFYFATALLSVLTFSTNALSQASQSYANTRVSNGTGAALGLLDIRGSNGKIVATLFITGKEASFDSHQKIFKGAGYIQAVQNEFINIIGIYKFKNQGDKEPHLDQMQSEVNRIDWDENGKTTSLSGIKPKVQTGVHGSLKITSDLQKPALTDGLLSLELEKLGKISLDIKCGDKLAVAGDPVFQF